MVKILLSIAFILFATPSLFAQTDNNRSVSISVSTDILGTAEVFTIQTVDFEGIERDDSIITIDPVTSERAGKMIVRGAPNQEFRLNYLQQRELTNTDGPGIINFTYLVSGNSIDEQNTSELFDQDDRDLSFNTDGEFYIWVGGSVDLSEVEPGNYQGEFNLEIEFN
jgi:hypothetical protein